MACSLWPPPVARYLADARTGKNGRHQLVGLLRQSLFGGLAGYEDVNDAERLCRDPALRWVVGDRAIMGAAASASQMGRFETKWLSWPENLAALADLPGQWIYRGLDDMLRLTDTGAETLASERTGKNGSLGWSACCANRCSGGWPATRT